MYICTIECRVRLLGMTDISKNECLETHGVIVLDRMMIIESRMIPCEFVFFREKVLLGKGRRYDDLLIRALD